MEYYLESYTRMPQKQIEFVNISLKISICFFVFLQIKAMRPTFIDKLRTKASWPQKHVQLYAISIC